MKNTIICKTALQDNGFTIINDIYCDEEVKEIIAIIEEADSSKETFRRSGDLFAIRQFLKEVPLAAGIIFNERLKAIIQEISGDNCFGVKSIYFDKPETSNWYVAYHQDLTISVDKKVPIDGYGPWSVKQHQYAVQPPLTILKNIFTIRIHLDDTNEKNGALKVIAGSHLKEIYRPETIDWNKETESVCRVAKGGIMIMKPLLLHSSGRTTNNNRRRVIHIECSNQELPEALQWAERLNLEKYYQ